MVYKPTCNWGAPSCMCIQIFRHQPLLGSQLVSIQHLLVAATAQASLVDFPVPQIRGLWHVLVALKIRRFLHHSSRKLMQIIQVILKLWGTRKKLNTRLRQYIIMIVLVYDYHVSSCYWLITKIKQHVEKCYHHSTTPAHATCLPSDQLQMRMMNCSPNSRFCSENICKMNQNKPRLFGGLPYVQTNPC